MVNKLAAAMGTVIGIWLIAGIASLLTFGPNLIKSYYPPITDFEIGSVWFDDDGAMYFRPSFHKNWCVYQPDSASWHAVTDGFSERVSLDFPDRPVGGQNRPVGAQRSGVWKVDISAAPYADTQFGVVTHKCLVFLTVDTTIGPWPVPLK